ncbi:PAS domain S-box protein [Saccharopolyspora sp. NPDC049426]|uniref:PAS domain S-box protein n=1 Tax=Saccharopolyspora sp. NPDC049426 TaxID=3155652 RepID=UPI003438F586
MSEGDPVGPPPESEWRSDVARRWTSELRATAYLPFSPEEVEASLAELLDMVVLALGDTSRAVEPGRAVGARLVEIRATGEESLSVTLKVLQDALLSDTTKVDALLSVLTEIAAGYAAADRESTFAQQETLNKALLASKLKTDRELKASEARFSEVFTSTPIGVAISDLEGRFVQVNPAFEQVLGYHRDDLAPMTIDRLFHPEDAEYLSASYRELIDGANSKRISDRKRLVRADGQAAWCYLGVSVLRGADGAPSGVVTMVEDITELHLLQDRFQHQALHDALTGLPNRGFFHTRLEAALVNLPRGGPVHDPASSRPPLLVVRRGRGERRRGPFRSTARPALTGRGPNPQSDPRSAEARRDPVPPGSRLVNPPVGIERAGRSDSPQPPIRPVHLLRPNARGLSGRRLRGRAVSPLRQGVRCLGCSPCRCTGGRCATRPWSCRSAFPRWPGSCRGADR